MYHTALLQKFTGTKHFAAGEKRGPCPDHQEAQRAGREDRRGGRLPGVSDAASTHPSVCLAGLQESFPSVS